MLEIGSVLDGKYKILNKIGQGGMSVVYLAMNEKANKQWAIKEVRKDGKQDIEVVKQNLIAETDILKKLSHPNLPSIIDVIDAEDSFLIVMDYIEGNSLSHAIKEGGAQPQAYVVEWAKQLCDVLGYLHSRKPPIIYRDLKPANIMLQPNGEVCLIDFGTAKEFMNDNVEETSCLGTRGYAAPEQYGGRGRTDARTDIYCLGATMYHLVTGRSPAEPPYEMKPIRWWDPTLSSGLEEIILKCTKTDPDERYQSCSELMFALNHYEDNDKEHRHKQKVKFGSFIATAVLMVLFLISSMLCGLRENQIKSDTYNSYMEQAGKTANKDDIVENCKRAIELDPSRDEAYDKMLDSFLKDEDRRFTDDESNTLIAVLNTKATNGNTNEELFATNTKGYAEFSYDVAIAYWYDYGNSSADVVGQSTLATRWFAKVTKLKDGTNSVQYNTAQIYVKIGNYYNELGIIARDGESDASYATYWQDLNELYNQEADSAITKLYLMRYILSSIYNNADNFKMASISKDEMSSLITQIEEAAPGVVIQNNSRADELKSDISRYADLANSKLSSTFS